MKILPFLAPILFALSLSGAAQAEVAVAAKAPIAHATIEAEQCAPQAGSRCSITHDNAVGEDGAVDLEALPKTGLSQQAPDKAAMAVPEPASAVMLALGLVLLGFTARRRPPVTFDN